jgi:RNA polymerase sigma factor (sigma-70 family)
VDHATAVEPEIDGCLDRDDWEAAVTVAYRAYGVEVFRYIVTLLRDRGNADGEDLAAELFLALLERRATFQRRSSFRSFMYAVARNLAVSALRGAVRRRAVPLSSADAVTLVEKVRSSTPEWERSSVKDALARIRGELDLEEQTLLVLLVDRRMSSDEVANAISDPDRPVTAAGVRKRFERLRHKLRGQLEEYGLLKEK